MLLVIQTQLQENYGAHDWDGKGECPQYWKFKGGSEFKVPLEGFRQHSEFADKNLRMIVDSLRDRIEENNDFYRVDIVSWSLEEDDYLSWYEKSQLEYDGVITFKEPVINLEEMV